MSYNNDADLLAHPGAGMPLPPAGPEIHHTLAPLKNCAVDIEDYDPRHMRDGAYSRVIFNAVYDFCLVPIEVVTEPTVLKLTCCSATQKLFDALLANPVEGLPRVYAAFGDCARDADGQVFKGYCVERLRPAERFLELAAMQLLQRHVKAALERLDQSKRPEGVIDMLTARWLSRKDFAGTGAAFAMLASVMGGARVLLDLFQPGNLLFNAHGQLCLADPVFPFEDILAYNTVTATGQTVNLLANVLV